MSRPDEDAEHWIRCGRCNGSGEGRTENLSCITCKGLGEISIEPDTDDFGEPVEPEPDYEREWGGMDCP